MSSEMVCILQCVRYNFADCVMRYNIRSSMCHKEILKAITKWCSSNVKIIFAMIFETSIIEYDSSCADIGHGCFVEIKWPI